MPRPTRGIGPTSPRSDRAAACGGAACRALRRPKQWRALDPVISEIAEAHGLPPALVKAVIATESNFDPEAVSSKGALGLMQLMPETAEWLGVGEPLAVKENVSGGTRYLRALIDRYGRLAHALAAYSAGPTNVDRYGGDSAVPRDPAIRPARSRLLSRLPWRLPPLSRPPASA
ncbi:MAG: lytic transglycosylase domain-containing protein [Desulfobacterales bacterium]|nr:lytic transglycosylase domain-containing protein [Desulfobacterales bacterium]